LNTVGSSGVFASPAGKYGVIRPGACLLVVGPASCRARTLLSMATCADGESPSTGSLSSRNELLREKKLPAVSLGRWVGEGLHSIFSTQQNKPWQRKQKKSKKLTVILKHEN